MSSPARNAHLDLLRASAITAVVVYHVVLMSPVALVSAMRLTKPGQYGVDLFFVLSGWLIGGLYWREHARFGNTEFWRFWLRRGLRTVPPYYCALALAWGAVYVQRHELMPWSYLFFGQNYGTTLPFFLVSWSLCIEEHFYLLLPLLLRATGQARLATIGLFTLLIVAAPIGRWLQPAAAVQAGFGFAWTATHLRLDGLLLGFAAAALPIHAPRWWAAVQANSRMLGAASALLIVLALLLPELAMYRIGLTLVAAGFVGILVSIVGVPAGVIAGSRAVNAMALVSYSTYLTHSLMLHVARLVLERLPWVPWPFYFPVALALIAAVSAAFYVAVERTVVHMRDGLVPRRARVATTGTTA